MISNKLFFKQKSKANRLWGRRMVGTTRDEKEIEKFSRISKEWWHPEGKMKPLLEMNPIRVQYIRSQLCNNFGKDLNALKPLSELKILDVGCGAGFLSESLAALGADVTAIDASESNIQVAKEHARKSIMFPPDKISYICSTAEDLLEKKEYKFDAVVSLEVIEHVYDPQLFVDTCSQLVDRQKNGLLIFSTLNRTVSSYLLSIIAAEKLLGIVPDGTHSWEKYLSPEEITGMVEKCGMKVTDVCGFFLNPITNLWSLSNNTSINYAITCR